MTTAVGSPSWLTTTSGHPLCCMSGWGDQWHADPKPFIWAKTADGILDSIGHYGTDIAMSADTNEQRHESA